jgi:steroid delta-isomerase-like uncharacterized protein
MAMKNTLFSTAFGAAIALAPPTFAAETPQIAAAPQYATTHVYVAPEDVDRFVHSFLTTFGGSSTTQVVATVTPTPSSTTSQLLQTPVGTVSLFGFKTPIPYPFGAERTGYLVTDLDAAVKAAQQDGANLVVAQFPDPIGRDAIIQWPGGVNLQLYWHTTKPNYAALQTVPENRIYLSPDRESAFVHSFLAFSHGKVVQNNTHAPGIEIGRPGDTYRRIRIESAFGKLALFVTDGHLPYPYGRELTGYDVPDVPATIAKAQASGASLLVAPFTADGRSSAMLQFPGGYVAEIHGPPGARQAAATPAPVSDMGPITQADIGHWAAAWNSHDIDTVLALFTPDVVIHQPSNPKPLDLAGARNFFSMIFKAYPDFHVDVTEALVDGWKAASVERVTGTWSGPLTDPATGKTAPGNGRSFDHPGVMLLTYTPDHRINDVAIVWDRLQVAQQLGLTDQK